MNNIGYFPLGQNYGYYLDITPKNVLDELKVQIDEIQNNFNIGTNWNEHLIGEIEHEYKIEAKYYTQEYIKHITEQIERESNYYNSQLKGMDNIKKDRNAYLDLSEMWVNYQKKHEYNPMHRHRGLYSFVIWYQIPYTFEEENNFTYKSPRNDTPHGGFSFIMPVMIRDKIDITYTPINVDRDKQGYCVIFPSSLHHMVAPFYSSDEYRITVAGNVLIK